MNAKPEFEWISSLRCADHNFQEALVPIFTVRRHSGQEGFNLKLEFSPDSYSI